MGENDYIKLSLGGQPYEFMIPADVAQHIRRKDNLLRELVEASKHMLDSREHVRVSGNRPDVDMFLAANRVLGAVIDKAEQELSDE